jgi:hypothetical protein
MKVEKSKDSGLPVSEQAPARHWLGRSVTFIFTAGMILSVALGVFLECVMITAEMANEHFRRYDYQEMEGIAKRKYSPSFIEKVKKFDKIDFNRMIKRLALSIEKEKIVLMHLEENLKVEQLQEILLGSSVDLKDGGLTYKAWVGGQEGAIFKECAKDHYYPIKGELIKGVFLKDAQMKLRIYPIGFAPVVTEGLDRIKQLISIP